MSEKVIMKTMDGNEARAHVAVHFTDVAGIFPITPSSPMSEKVDEWAARTCSARVSAWWRCSPRPAPPAPWPPHLRPLRGFS